MPEGIVLLEAEDQPIENLPHRRIREDQTFIWLPRRPTGLPLVLSGQSLLEKCHQSFGLVHGGPHLSRYEATAVSDDLRIAHFLHGP